LNKEADRTCNR